MPLWQAFHFAESFPDVNYFIDTPEVFTRGDYMQELRPQSHSFEPKDLTMFEEEWAYPLHVRLFDGWRAWVWPDDLHATLAALHLED